MHQTQASLSQIIHPQGVHRLCAEICEPLCLCLHNIVSRLSTPSICMAAIEAILLGERIQKNITATALRPTCNHHFRQWFTQVASVEMHQSSTSEQASPRSTVKNSPLIAAPALTRGVVIQVGSTLSIPRSSTVTSLMRTACCKSATTEL